MAYRLTTTLGAAALALACLGAAPAFAQETATPSSPESADKDTSAKVHPMHHAAMHPHMHGKMHSGMMHGKMHGDAMADGAAPQGVRSQDMGTDALNNRSLQAAQSNSAFTPGQDSAMPMHGGMHGKMMHGKMMHGSMDQGSMSGSSMGQGSMSNGAMGSTGGTMPAQTSGTTGSMGGGNEGNGAMAGSSTGGVGGAAGTPMPKP